MLLSSCCFFIAVVTLTHDLQVKFINGKHFNFLEWVSHIPGCPQTHHIADNDWELLTLLPLSPSVGAIFV